MSKWIEIAGPQEQISVGSAEYIWGIDDLGAGTASYLSIPPYTWNEAPASTGALLDVSVGWDGTVLGVDMEATVYQYQENSWTQLASTNDAPGIKQLSVGSSSQIWATDHSGAVYKLASLDVPLVWTPIADIVLTDVSVGADGTVFGVNDDSNDTIYQYQGGTWIPSPPPQALTQISVGSESHVWGVNRHGSAYELVGFYPTTSKWEKMNPDGPSLIDVSVGIDGTVFGVNGAGQVYWYFC